MALTADSVALYWDFENLHASLIDQAYGQGAYLANRFRPQEPLLDISAIVEFALSIGPIAVNRAFANWLSFNRYRQALLHNAVELIQVFPPGANAKNGADIKLCLDVMDDMARFAHIGTIVVVGGDSDYMPLSYKVKAAGRTLVGIGSRPTTNQHWARSCHEFKFYETLLAPPAVSDGLVLPPGLAARADASPAAAATADAAATPGPAVAAVAEVVAAADGVADAAPGEVPAAALADATPPAGGHDELRRLLDLAVETQQRQREARDLVAKALLRLGQMRGDAWIHKARLRPYIQRMDPTFHEASYGFDSFNALLASMDGLVETRRGEFDHELRLRAPVGALDTAPAGRAGAEHGLADAAAAGEGDGTTDPDLPAADEPAAGSQALT